MRHIRLIIFVTFSGIAIAEEERVLSLAALSTEAGLRCSVEEALPGSSFGFYHSTDSWIIGALEDFDRDRSFFYFQIDRSVSIDCEYHKSGQSRVSGHIRSRQRLANVLCDSRVSDQDRREPADAYEISRDSLSAKARKVLATNDKCVVRLASRRSITVEKWQPPKKETIQYIVEKSL